MLDIQFPEEQLKKMEEVFDAIHLKAEGLIDEFNARVDAYRETITDPSERGDIGIMQRPNKEKGGYYYYWGKFKKNYLYSTKTISSSERRKPKAFQKLIKKGGGSSFQYKMSVFSGKVLPWELELIKEFEPKLAIIREGLKHQRTAIRTLKRTQNIVDKILKDRL